MQHCQFGCVGGNAGSHCGMGWDSDDGQSSDDGHNGPDDFDDGTTRDTDLTDMRERIAMIQEANGHGEAW